jgi:Ca2+-binding RTX toxin-like protein
VNVSLGGVANDGAPGEGDNNEASVEDVIAGTGNDTIRGNSESNRLFGGRGNDNLNSIDNNFGNDRLEGSEGFDICTADPVDLRIGCEA